MAVTRRWLAPTEAPMTTTVTTEYSTLQNPPHDFSRRQVLFIAMMDFAIQDGTDRI